MGEHTGVYGRHRKESGDQRWSVSRFLTVAVLRDGGRIPERAATGDEIKVMQGAFRDAMAAGALGMSISTNKSHFDPHGVEIPAVWASEEELFAMGDVLTEFGTA